MTLSRLARIIAVVCVCGGASLMSAPVHAHHAIDFESHDCDREQPSPSPTGDEEPDLTTPPSEPPDGGEQPPPNEEPTPAPQDCMPAENERIWGTRTLKFSTSTDGTRPLQRVALFIRSEEKAIPHPNGGDPLLEVKFTREQDVRTYDTPFSWNSVEQTPRNGRYKVAVVVDTYPAVTGNEPHRAMRERGRLRVDNPPRPAGAPKVIATTFDSVTIQWHPAPEPDVISYTIYRATTMSGAKRPPYSAFKPVASTSGASFRDTTVKPGVHWYTIRVTRRSIVTPKEGISSTLGPISGPGEVKTVQQFEEETDDGGSDRPRRPIAYRDLAPPRVSSRLAAVPDAPFAYKLPYGDVPVAEGSSFEGGASEEPGSDPRGPVLPVAVGMFLVSSALAVGRMPY